jgi:hypothetical protein
VFKREESNGQEELICGLIIKKELLAVRDLLF